jgi:hypothetical protein
MGDRLIFDEMLKKQSFSPSNSSAARECAGDARRDRHAFVFEMNSASICPIGWVTHRKKDAEIMTGSCRVNVGSLFAKQFEI